MYFLIDDDFPDPDTIDEYDGMVAIGGNLKPQTLLKAYSLGYFPWYNEDEPIAWYNPTPRLVLYPNKIKVSHSMKQLLKKQPFDYTFNTCFDEVIAACRNKRIETGTWISDDIIKAYTALHRLGFAVSVEVWQNKNLVGGLYGVLIGKAFFGESMFANVSNASKAALIWFCYHCMQTGIKIIDCQQSTAHLKSMGAEEISRQKFLKELSKAI
ncbi:MAG: leucyl/phenylalanyl-tRNA--protein transferase [Bacteroidia bacterium]